MGLIGEVNNRPFDAILQQSVTCRHERGQVSHRSAANEQSAGRVWKSASSAKPTHHAEFDRGRGRSTEPRPVKNIEPGGERVSHRAHEIVRPGHESEKTRMIDMEIVWKNIALELR